MFGRLLEGFGGQRLQLPLQVVKLLDLEGVLIGALLFLLLEQFLLVGEGLAFDSESLLEEGELPPFELVSRCIGRTLLRHS